MTRSPPSVSASPARELLDAREAPAGAARRPAPRGTTIAGVARPSLRSEGRCRWSPCRWRDQHQVDAGPGGRAGQAATTRRSGPMRGGEQRVGEHGAAGQLDPHRRVAEEAQLRARHRASIGATGATRVSSHFGDAGAALPPARPAGRTGCRSSAATGVDGQPGAAGPAGDGHRAPRARIGRVAAPASSTPLARCTRRSAAALDSIAASTCIARSVSSRRGQPAHVDPDDVQRDAGQQRRRCCEPMP